jgi:hypothetical protein
MKRFLLVFSIVVLLPLITPAYTLILKDGRRVEVKDKYRIVGEVAVFTLPEGNRFSLSLDKINISATELANSGEAGSFVKNAADPPKATDKQATTDKPNVDEDVIASSRPTARKITNSDFERYKVRREEMMKDVANRASEKALTQPPVTPDPNAEHEAAFMAERREREKNKEQYWRSRAKALLTELRVEEEQIVSLQMQMEQGVRLQSPSTVSVYNPPTPVYPYPGVSIGGIPIGIGTAPQNRGSVVVINQNPNYEGRSLQERLVELRLKHQGTIIRYQEMCDEARRDGALPGWLR